MYTLVNIARRRPQHEPNIIPGTNIPHGKLHPEASAKRNKTCTIKMARVDAWNIL